MWEESIIFSGPNVRFLCLSATIPNADEFASWIHTVKKHTVDVIRQIKRNVPLHRKFYDADLGICSLEDIQEVNGIPDYDRVMPRRGKKPRFKSPSHINLIKDKVKNPG